MRILTLIGAISLFTLFGCSNEEPTIVHQPSGTTLTLNINGLEDLGADALYEGWIIVSGSPVSTGTFSVDANGNLSKTEFELDANELSAATAFVLTIEPNPDSEMSSLKSQAEALKNELQAIEKRLESLNQDPKKESES